MANYLPFNAASKLKTEGDAKGSTDEDDDASYEVEKLKMVALTEMVKHESECGRWMEATASATKVKVLFRKHVESKYLVQNCAAMVLKAAVGLSHGDADARLAMYLLFYAVAAGFVRHHQYEDAARVYRKLIDARRGTWRRSRSKHYGVPRCQSEATKEASDLKRMLDLRSKTERGPETTCSICLESLGSGTVEPLGCLHVFHQSCIFEWCEKKTQRILHDGQGNCILTSNCPQCREQFVMHTKKTKTCRVLRSI